MCFIAANGTNVRVVAKRRYTSFVIQSIGFVLFAAAAVLLLLKGIRWIGEPGYDVPYSRVEREIDMVIERILRG